MRLDPDVPRPEFSCGDPDLDEFYQSDSIENAKQLLSVTYAMVDEDDQVIAYFSLSNDSIRKKDVPRSAFERIVKILPFTKRYSSMPATKIGRLGTARGVQRKGYGTAVLDYLKAWFTLGNKTGCRFLVVDAYNKDPVTKFYTKNGFRFLSGEDKFDDTRIMYFDLIRFRE